jgi:hypothetical protein
MVWMRRAARLLPLVSLFLLCASCSDFWVSNSSTASVSLGSGVILKAASSATAGDGDSDQLHLYANTVGGTTSEVTTSATWTSSNPAVATVTANGGLVQVVGTSGNVTVTITATYSGQTATATVLTYTGATPTALNALGGIPTNSGTLSLGQTFQLTASANLNGNSAQDITSYVTWVSSNTNAATVSSTGLVTVSSNSAEALAQFTITANASFATTTVPSPAASFTVI